MSIDAQGAATEARRDGAEGWMADASTFGARLALIRQRMGWGNVKTAAEQCGLPVESWRTWERDGVEPRRQTTIAMTIATRTGCDYLWLVHGPNRGSTVRTFAYVGPRVIGQIGEPGTTRPNRHHGVPVQRAHPGRPVRQTRPMAGATPRPMTPVAV